jgi:YHS domain-containing protein
MGILARIFRFLFWTLVLSWGIWLLRRLLGAHVQGGQASAEEQQQGPSIASGKRLVRDPQCGMHVAEELSVPVSMGSEMIHFCSPACRDQYLRETQKLAANG